MQKKQILCLGIESSCDETAAAIVDSERQIISHVIYSQIPTHQKWGGVVPELAARSHILAIDEVVKKTLEESKLNLSDIDVIAATAGPGLIGGVIVGWEFACGLAEATKKPLVAINHLEGHALVPRLSNDVEFPYLLLLVSGGHSQILIVRGVGKYELLGETLDDSAGEAFDKVAKMLGLGYPGGPAVANAAVGGNINAFQFPRPLCHQDNCDFSFSGVKTAARTFLTKNPDVNVSDFCASFQQTVVDVVINRLSKAMDRAPGIKTLVVAGGVAANKEIRAAMEKLAHDRGMEFAAPKLSLCTDNGAMIAWAGIENYLIGNTVKEPVSPRPRWPLTEL
jgi:N6-L-threonylcarbamoyladenine synthase